MDSGKTFYILSKIITTFPCAALQSALSRQSRGGLCRSLECWLGDSTTVKLRLTGKRHNSGKQSETNAQ